VRLGFEYSQGDIMMSNSCEEMDFGYPNTDLGVDLALLYWREQAYRFEWKIRLCDGPEEKPNQRLLGEVCSVMCIPCK
jgi:hypothetical protein